MYIDLSKPGSIKAAAQLSQDVTIVINNAAVLSKTSALDGNAIEALKSDMDVNVYGLMAMAQAYAPILKQNSGPSAFVQINSVASFRCSGTDVAIYSATKAAAYSITQALAQELATMSESSRSTRDRSARRCCRNGSSRWPRRRPPSRRK